MTYDVTIIGGGIVGLATAYQITLKNKDLKICILEKEDDVAKHQTGHNSGVIHSGIYYKPGSLKAKNCINGYNMLLDFCKKHDIKYNLCGKVIVATDESEIPLMETIYERGTENGLEGLKKLDKKELKEHEPHVNGVAGIFVPQTGIIDYAEVCRKYLQEVKNHGGEIFFNEKVTAVDNSSTITTVKSTTKSINSKYVVNCAGLFSDKVAKLTDKNTKVKIIPFRGEYYMIKPEKQHLVKTLIYPVPDPNFPFLGVHFTNMINGGVEAGPNAVFAFKREGYSWGDFSLKDTIEALAWKGFRKVMFKYWKTGLGEYKRSLSKKAFTKALQKLIPEIKEEDLVPGGAGVRAQACDWDGGLLDDFKITEGKGVINVLNAPSPAATSSLSIGDTVSDLLLKKM